MIRKLNRTTLYVIIVCVLLLAVNVLLGLLLTNQSAAALRTMIENRMLDISNTAAAMLDGDMLDDLEAADESSEAYQTVLRTLKYYQDNIDLQYIYCIRDMGNDLFVFTIDPSDDPGEFGQPVVTTEALRQAARGIPAVDKEPYEDDWGRFYSAYTPVFDSNGIITGIVAVDFSAEWYEEQVAGHVRTTLLVSVISLAFTGLIIVLIVTRYRKRFRTMLNEMNVVSGRIETLVREVSPGAEIKLPENGEHHPNDEVAELGDRLQAMENQLSEQIAFVRSQAYVDGLTGLGNRTAYEDHVKQLDEEVRKGEASFAVALFDLNGLKEINDHQGHDRGDKSISAVAGALKKTFGEAKIYRIGGDEFVVILENGYAGIDGQLEEVGKFAKEAEQVSIAKGCAVFTPDTDTGYHDVFRRADNAMYEDKKQYYTAGRDRRKR